MTMLDAASVRRCCPRHDDLPTLTEHLLSDFSNLDDDQVITQIVRATDAVDAFAIPDEDRLEMVEVVARQQLMLLTGEVADAARLDPEIHVRDGLRPLRR